MTNNEKTYARALQAQYAKRDETPSKTERLRELDKKVTTPALIFAYIFGSIGSLILGFGMCLAMNILPALIPDAVTAMIVGIIIGVVGIAIVSVNYPIYGAILNSRKKKYADQINALCDEILAD